MPVTRTKLNLKDTSIRDHLLIKKSDQHSTINQTSEENMGDTKHHIPGTPIKASHQDQHSIINDENSQLLTKPSNDDRNAIDFTNNEQHKLSPTAAPINQYALGSTLENKGQQQPKNGIKSTTTHSQYVNSMTQIFSGEKNEDAGLWLDHIFALIEQNELTSTEQRDMPAARLTGKALL
jgi:hypothetical protein